MEEMEEIEEERSARQSEYPKLDAEPTYAWPGGPSASRDAVAASPEDGDAEEWDDDDVNSPSESDLDIEDGSPTSGHYGGQFLEGGYSSSEYDSSDEDEEFYTLQSDVASFQQKLRRVQKNHDNQSQLQLDDLDGKRGGKSGRRGPRKAVEPSLEIKLLLSQANEAFISKDYDRAEELATRVIQMNAETYAAHALLSGIFLERGETQMGIVAQMSAAHLRPKDVGLWRSCVNLILDHSRDDRPSYLNDAIYCYTRMVQINPKDIESRYQRALLLRELGQKGRAAHEFEQMLDMLPNDTTLLRQLAEVYVDLNEVEKAKEQYRKHISLAMDPDDSDEAEEVTWSDINIFVELFGISRDYLEGIKQLKTLSRWLLGREQERCWDDIEEDDREWDADDFPRRIMTPGFIQGLFGRESYGEGLPMELRVKLGLYRLKADPRQLPEAMSHFEWLQPDECHPEAKLFDYPDLFQDIADGLQATGCYREALRYYKPLLQVESYHNVQLCLKLATCYNRIGLTVEAEQYYNEVVENDARNKEARIQLAKIYEAQGMPDKAFTYVNEVLELERQDADERRLMKQRSGTGTVAANNADSFLPPPSQAPRTNTRKRHGPSNSAKEREEREKLREDAVRIQYIRLQAVEDRMKSGDEDALDEWMEAASLMIDDFRNAKVFYPWDKYIKFLGYTRGPQGKSSRSKDDLVADLEAMGNRLQASIQQAEGPQKGEHGEIPTTYRDISFTEWLDIFLRYALCLSKRGETRAAYDVINAAYDAIVFYHSSDAVFLIYVCWSGNVSPSAWLVNHVLIQLACALLASDDETLCNVARWFMKEFQFTTDAYRFHAALNRLCRGPNSWYNSGPSQKFILRQIKAMDYSLVNEEQRTRHFAEKASYTAKDAEGHLMVNDDMDVALLTLYGHMLYAGTNYAYALHYLFRAYALDPKNALLNLFLSLCYIHYALKRQSINRHHLIMQGLSFLFDYHRLRMQSQDPVERQEAEFNVARTFHTLGLAHLALPYYEKALDMATTVNQTRRPDSDTQDFARDAAFNLQNIYSMTGNWELARKVTEKYLVI